MAASTKAAAPAHWLFDGWVSACWFLMNRTICCAWPVEKMQMNRALQDLDISFLEFQYNYMD